MTTPVAEARHRRTMGQSLVETALVLPFLLALIFGVFELGRIVFVFSAVNNASREATRYGAATGATQGGVPRYLNCNAIRQAAIDTAFLAGLTAADIDVQYDTPNGTSMQVYAECVGNTVRDTSTSAVISSSDVSAGDRVVVTVQRQIDPILPIFPGFNPIFTTARTILKDIAIGPPECNDGVDNDGDGNIDFPSDDGCSSADDTTETICYRLFVSVVPEDGGTIGYNPGTNCANRYIEQTGVNLEAIADVRNDPTLRPEYTFDYWEGPVNTGDGSDTNPTTVTMTGDKDVTAHFRRVEANLGINKQAQPGTSIGSSKDFYYSFEVINYGPDTAHDLVIEDTLPVGIIYRGWRSPDPDVDCDISALPTISCSYPELADANYVLIYIDVTSPVANGTPIQLSNTVMVNAVEYDSDAANNTDTENVTVHPRAELSIVKEGPDPSSTVWANSEFDYTIRVTNDGPSNATNVVITDELPPSLQFVPPSSPSPDDCTYNASNHTVTCNITSIAASSSSAVTFRVRAPVNGTPVNNVASVIADETEDDTSDNTSDAVTTDVQSHADLRIVKIGPTAASRDSVFNYVLTIHNAGPSTANEVLLEDVLAAGLDYSSHVNASGNCGMDGATFQCSLGNIPAGATRQVTLSVQSDQEGTYQNSATVRSSGAQPVTDRNLSNNTSGTVTTNVTTDVQLEVDKSASPSTVNVNDNFSYNIVVTNNGDSTARNVELTDALPARVNFQNVSAPTGWSCPYDSSQRLVTCTPPSGTLVGGASATITINVTAVSAGSPNNTANLTSSDDNASDSTSVTIDEFDLGVVVNAPANAVVGTAYQVDLVASNSGTLDATAVQLQSTLSTNVAFVTGSLAAPIGWTCSYNAGVVNCAINALPAGAAATISYQIAPQAPGTIDNQGQITADQSNLDTNQSNDSATSTTIAQ